MLLYLYRKLTTHKESTAMTYQIIKNDTVIKTISAKTMNSIYTQFNGYAKKRGATAETRNGAIGVMVWILANQDVLSLSAV